jgi:preprotein translocase subunit SecD
VLRVIFSSSEIRRGSARVIVDQAGYTGVVYALTPQASSAWCSFTTSHISRFAALVLDGRVISDPQIQSAICGGQTQIVGLASRRQATMIAAYLNYGPLPVTLRSV